jgi:hypothetical protein
VVQASESTRREFSPATPAQPLTDYRQALDDRNSTNVKDGLERVVAAIKRATEALKKGRE